MYTVVLLNMLFIPSFSKTAKKFQLLVFISRYLRMDCWNLKSFDIRALGRGQKRGREGLYGFSKFYALFRKIFVTCSLSVLAIFSMRNS